MYCLTKMECEYCEKILANKRSLAHHQKTSKYCLRSRKICSGCNESFTIYTDLKNHMANCIHYIKKDDVQKLKRYKDLITQQKEEIESLKEENSNLKKNLNKSKIELAVSKLTPLDINDFPRWSEYLTLQHICGGVRGYVKYAMQYIFKDKLVCTDFSRKKIAYKDVCGNTIIDIGLEKICSLFFASIKHANIKIINKYHLDQVKNIKSIKAFDSLDRWMAFVRNGVTNDFTSDHYKFIKQICKLVAI